MKGISKRLLLVGIEQSSWEKWIQGPPVAAWDPFHETAELVPFPILKEPFFSSEEYDGVVLVTPNHRKTDEALLARLVETGLPCLVLKMRAGHGDGVQQVSSLPSEMKAKIFVGDQYRYLPGAMVVTEALRQGQGHANW